MCRKGHGIPAVAFAMEVAAYGSLRFNKVAGPWSTTLEEIAQPYLGVTVITTVGRSELLSENTKLIAQFLIAERDTSLGH